jgi:hypothetical protein
VRGHPAKLLREGMEWDEFRRMWDTLEVLPQEIEMVDREEATAVAQEARTTGGLAI